VLFDVVDGMCVHCMRFACQACCPFRGEQETEVEVAQGQWVPRRSLAKVTELPGLEQETEVEVAKGQWVPRRSLEPLSAVSVLEHETEVEVSSGKWVPRRSVEQDIRCLIRFVCMHFPPIVGTSCLPPLCRYHQRCCTAQWLHCCSATLSDSLCMHIPLIVVTRCLPPRFCLQCCAAQWCNTTRPRS
jgi:hypothetical protein